MTQMRQLDLTTCWVGGAEPDAALDPLDIETVGDFIALQKKVCAVLAAWLPLAPVFAQKKPGVCVYEDKHTIVNDVATALQAVGVSMVVGLKGAKRHSAMKNAITLSPLTFTVSVAERPITNRGANGSGMTCSLVALHVMLALSGLRIANGICELTDIQSGGDDVDGLQVQTLAFTTALQVTPPDSLLTE